MLSPKFRLVLALALATSSLTFLAVTLNSAKSVSNPNATNILKARILRRKDKLRQKLDDAEVAELRKQANAQDTPEERKFEDQIPKHVPIKFKLRADKEKKFKDLNNHGWYRDFELEVTNTSDKPIYYVELWLEFPEIDAAPGVPLAIPLRYGRLNFIYQQTRPLPTDVPIQPGATYVFTIPESDRKGWEAHKRRDNIPDPKKTVLTFVQLSFGDGTGFATSGAKPYPFRDHQSFAPFCRGRPATTVAQGGMSKRPADLQTTARNNWLLGMTAKHSGGHFSFVSDNYSFLENSSASTDTCCGSGCYFLKSNMESCSCGESPGFDAPACTDPEALAAHGWNVDTGAVMTSACFVRNTELSHAWETYRLLLRLQCQVRRSHHRRHLRQLQLQSRPAIGQLSRITKIVFATSVLLAASLFGIVASDVRA